MSFHATGIIQLSHAKIVVISLLETLSEKQPKFQRTLVRRCVGVPTHVNIAL